MIGYLYTRMIDVSICQMHNPAEPIFNVSGLFSLMQFALYQISQLSRAIHEISICMSPVFIYNSDFLGFGSRMLLDSLEECQLLVHLI
jgi:hypothetical protein